MISKERKKERTVVIDCFCIIKPVYLGTKPERRKTESEMDNTVQKYSLYKI
jgi:hypothetical protein